MRRHQNKPSRRHHYRPRWYLKGFSIQNNQNNCHAIEVISGRPFRNHVSNLGVETDFYRILDNVAGIEPDTAVFDGLASKVFSNVISEDYLLLNDNEFAIIKESISRMITFDPSTRNTMIKGLELISPPSITEERKQIIGEPLPLILTCSTLPINRGIVNNLNYKLMVVDKDNYFICPDGIYFTATRDEEIHLFFPLNKNLCLYGCSSEDILANFSPSTSLVNTLLLLHSYQYLRQIMRY